MHHDIKCIFQRFGFFQPQFFDPVLAQPHQTRSMVCDSLRDRHQFSVKSHRIQKVASVALKHFFDSFGSAIFVNLTQICHQIIIDQFFECFSVRHHQNIRERLVFDQDIYEFIVTVFSLHVDVFVLDVQHLSEITGVGIVFVSISIREVRIVCTAHLSQSIGHKLRICSIRCLRGCFPGTGADSFFCGSCVFCFCRCFTLICLSGDTAASA